MVNKIKSGMDADTSSPAAKCGPPTLLYSTLVGIIYLQWAMILIQICIIFMRLVPSPIIRILALALVILILLFVLNATANFLGLGKQLKILLSSMTTIVLEVFIALISFIVGKPKQSIEEAPESATKRKIKAETEVNVGKVSPSSLKSKNQKISKPKTVANQPLSSKSQKIRPVKISSKSKSPKTKESMKEPVELITKNESISKSPAPINSSLQKPSNIEEPPHKIAKKIQDPKLTKPSTPKKVSQKKNEKIQASNLTKPSTPKKVRQKNEKIVLESLQPEKKFSSKEPVSSSQTSSNIDETTVDAVSSSQTSSNIDETTVDASAASSKSSPQSLVSVEPSQPENHSHQEHDMNINIKFSKDEKISKISFNTTEPGEATEKLKNEVATSLGLLVATFDEMAEENIEVPVNISLQPEDDIRESDGIGYQNVMVCDQETNTCRKVEIEKEAADTSSSGQICTLRPLTDS